MPAGTPAGLRDVGIKVDGYGGDCVAGRAGCFCTTPGSGTAIGSDHYVVVTGVEDGIVRFHDPHGHPYATLPVDDFVAAWRADSIGYAARLARRLAPAYEQLRASLPGG